MRRRHASLGSCWRARRNRLAFPSSPFRRAPSASPTPGAKYRHTCARTRAAPKQRPVPVARAAPARRSTSSKRDSRGPPRPESTGRSPPHASHARSSPVRARRPRASRIRPRFAANDGTTDDRRPRLCCDRSDRRRATRADMRSPRTPSRSLPGTRRGDRSRAATRRARPRPRRSTQRPTPRRPRAHRNLPAAALGWRRRASRAKHARVRRLRRADPFATLPESSSPLPGPQ